MNYRLHEAFAKERRSETITKTLLEQLPSVRSDVDMYRLPLSLYTGRFSADVINGSSGFMYSSVTYVKNLVERQREDI